MTKKLSATEERLQQIQQTIGRWNEFAQTLTLPVEFAAAVSSGRMSLMKLARPRALSVEECDHVYRLVEVLIETNALLQEHSMLIARMAEDATRSIDGARGAYERLCAYGVFRMPSEDDDDG